MFVDNKVLIGKSNDKELCILPHMANRHGLITGASGSGKTITLKVMAESFASAGVPCFLADVKGDLAGMCVPGTPNDKIAERLDKLNIHNFEFEKFPTVFWDVYGNSGHPIRTTVSNVGATILSRMLGLTEAQAGVLAIAFKVAKDTDMELIDLKDLRLLLQKIGDNRTELTLNYGNISVQSVGAIQRSILMLQEQGGDLFFGEPAIDINDFLKFDTETGYGNINILHAVELFKQPVLYSCFMLWILTFLNQTLPEVGDLAKPKMVFFFDEAHLLFDDMPKYMLTQVIQVVKLIRSKGVGLYFISQTPNDIPNDIQAQLGNRVQHTLRAYTPSEQKIVKAVADSFRTNPEINTEEAILSLGTGEALVSFLTEKGEPGIVEKVTILPPQSQMGTIEDSIRNSVIEASRFKGKYDELIDRESAFEKIQKEELALAEEAIENEQVVHSDTVTSQNTATANQPQNNGFYGNSNGTANGFYSNAANNYYNQTANNNTNISTNNSNNVRNEKVSKEASTKSKKTPGRKKQSFVEKATNKTTNAFFSSLGRKGSSSLIKEIKKLFK